MKTVWAFATLRCKSYTMRLMLGNEEATIKIPMAKQRSLVKAAKLKLRCIAHELQQLISQKRERLEVLVDSPGARKSLMSLLTQGISFRCCCCCSLRQVLLYNLRLSGWPQIHSNPPALATQVLTLQAWVPSWFPFPSFRSPAFRSSDSNFRTDSLCLFDSRAPRCLGMPPSVPMF